ncbi:glycosyltransferase [Microbacterium sp. F51-2R]|uniref:glycosyltransferase n=1 Tax=Microbacterium sp. F51-2R TaxID=3445777 RepID=UPI003FA0CDE0
MQSLGVQSGQPVLNPYTKLFTDAIAEHVVVLPFSWGTALRGEFDVFHIHWPEHLIRGAGAKGYAKPFLFRSLLARTRRRKIAVVRTVHNLTPHEQGSSRERRLMQKLEDSTTVWIAMNSATPTPDQSRTVRILHGHYRDWYPSIDVVPEVGRILYFGGIRDYKGVDQLIKAFTGMRGDFALAIAGKVSQPRIQSEIESLAASDPRIQPDLRFLSDAELATAIATSEVVVLPYNNLHNSGSALLALSMNRPVIVPSTPTTEELRQEFGHAWVHTYEGNLTSTILGDQLARVRETVRDDHVDMSRREWASIAKETLGAYEVAIAVARATGGSRAVAESPSPTGAM